MRSRIQVVWFALLLAPLAAFATPPADLDRYVERAMTTFGVPGFAVGIAEPHQAPFARGYGVRYHLAETADELGRALRAAYAEPGATLVHVRVSPSSYQEAVDRLRALSTGSVGREGA